MNATSRPTHRRCSCWAGRWAGRVSTHRGPARRLPHLGHRSASAERCGEARLVELGVHRPRYDAVGGGTPGDELVQPLPGLRVHLGVDVVVNDDDQTSPQPGRTRSGWAATPTTTVQVREDRSGTLNARSCSRSAPTPCSRGPLALSGLRPTRALSGMRVRSYTAVVHVIGNLWNFADPAIDRLGCDWHFSARDHRLIATKLGDHLAGLGITW